MDTENPYNNHPRLPYLQSKVTQWCKQAIERDGDYSYYWELSTPIIVKNREILDQHFERFLDEKIDERRLRTYFDTYLLVVKKESFKKWEEGIDAAKRRLGMHPDMLDWYEPIPSVELPYRELRYINERWANWCWRDGEHNLEHTSPWKMDKRGDWNYDEPFSNQFPPPRFEPIDTTIRSLEWRLPIGQKHKGKRLADILRVDAQYLKWLVGKNRFTFSEEILAKIQEINEKEAFWD